MRVRARVGVGLAGNLPAGTLTKIAKPHPLVSAVQQPLPAVGGNDRGNGRFAAQDRADDAAHARTLRVAGGLCVARGGPRQHLAGPGVRPPELGTRAHRVEVVVVPADGAELGELAQTLATFLQSHALPNVEVTVTRFVPLPVTLAVTVEIDLAAFDPAVVLHDVRAALYDALSLRRRQLGQPVFLGDIYAVVENVPGVSTSRCVLNDDPTANRILSLSDAVQFLDPGQARRRWALPMRPSHDGRSRIAGRPPAVGAVARALPRRDNGDLASYVDALGEVLDLLRGIIQQRLADTFPDDPGLQPWVLPYLADLIDPRVVSADETGGAPRSPTRRSGERPRARLAWSSRSPPYWAASAGPTARRRRAPRSRSS